MSKNNKIIFINTSSLERSKPILTSLYYNEQSHNHQFELSDLIKPIDYMINFQKTRGPDQLMKLVKATRLSVLSYLSGGSVVQDFPLWLKRDKRGLPSFLGKLKDPKILLNPGCAKFTLSIVFITRWLQFECKPDFSPIKDSGVISIHPSFIDFIHSPENRLSYLPGHYKDHTIDYYTSTKAGPNGPALMSSINDLYSLPLTYKNHLTNLIMSIDPDSQILDNLVEELPEKEELNIGEVQLRKISIVDDKEGKARIIAIVDYWTQCIMKSIHRSLNGILRLIPNDCTFNQSRFKTLSSFYGKETFYSIDLKAATELMPSNWQGVVLGWLTGRTLIGDEWLCIMRDFGFNYKDDILFYKRGQPMGIYSSWPMMAITHHLLLHWACHRKNIALKHYALLGDDLLIIGEEVYSAYKEVVQLCGMILNETKTFQSKDLFEFAKRFFYKGVEITPFPIGAVINAQSSLPSIAVAIDNSFEKSWLRTLSYNEAARKSFLLSLLKAQKQSVPYRFWKDLEAMVGITSLFKWVTGEEGLEPPILIGWVLKTLPCNKREKDLRVSYRGYLARLLMNEANKKVFEHLQSALNLQMHITMSEFRTYPEIFTCHPGIRLVSQFSNKLAEFQNQVLSDIETSGIDKLSIEDLMDLNISPIPSLNALYRMDKGAVRRVHTLSLIAKTFRSLATLDWERIDVRQILPSGTNMF